jgi:TM2 domain-containing membrane protein YozV
MTIIKLFWQTIVLLICCLIQMFGVIVEGIAKMLAAFAEVLTKLYNWVYEQKDIKKKDKSEFDIAL